MSKLEVPSECLIKNVTICFDKLLGTGSYGIVYLAIYHGTKVAAKRLHEIFFDGVNPKEYEGILQSWRNELRLMNSLRHPNIVQFYGVFNLRDSSSPLLTGNSYIITELLAKSLQARNIEKPRLTIKHIINIAMDIAAGLCYLHNRENPIMHRDLASKNVLLSLSGQAKIADLGVAKFTAQVQQSHTRHPGTDYYMPLETMVSGDIYDHSIDVYALGVIILEMAIGKDPTATQSLKRVGDRFEIVPETERRRNDLMELKNHSNVILNQVIMLCLRDRETRVSADKVIMHLEELKKSEVYESCKSFPIFEIKSSTDMHKENEYLKHKIQELQEEIKELKELNIKLQDELEKQTLKSKSNVYTHERALNSLKPQMQQTMEYVGPTGSSRLPRSEMVMPTQAPLSSNHPPSYPAVHSASFDQPQPLSMNYNSLDQKPRSLYQQRINSGLYGSDIPETHASTVYARDSSLKEPTRHYSFAIDRDFSSLPPRVSNIPAIQLGKATEYLTYQLSCMERVMIQLQSTNSNTSENLITSFVETLKEQIIKTADYIRKLPNDIKTSQHLQVPLQKIHQMLSGVQLYNIPQKYTQDLYTAVRNFQDASKTGVSNQLY